MSEHTKVYVECENMCKEEGMTKVQIEEKLNDIKVKTVTATVKIVADAMSNSTIVSTTLNSHNCIILNAELYVGGIWYSGLVFSTAGTVGIMAIRRTSIDIQLRIERFSNTGVLPAGTYSVRVHYIDI